MIAQSTPCVVRRPLSLSSGGALLPESWDPNTLGNLSPALFGYWSVKFRKLA